MSEIVKRATHGLSEASQTLNEVLGNAVAMAQQISTAAEQLAQQMTAHAQMLQQHAQIVNAPKRIVRDPVSGRATGVEPARTVQ